MKRAQAFSAGRGVWGEGSAFDPWHHACASGVGFWSPFLTGSAGVSDSSLQWLLAVGFWSWDMVFKVPLSSAYLGFFFLFTLLICFRDLFTFTRDRDEWIREMRPELSSGI